MGDVNAEYFTSTLSFYEDPNQAEEDEWTSFRQRTTRPWTVTNDDESDGLLPNQPTTPTYSTNDWDSADEKLVDAADQLGDDVTDKPPFMTKAYTLFISMCVFMAGVCNIMLGCTLFYLVISASFDMTY
jgi:hypothetical protein